MYLNKAFIIGNLTRDPELKALSSGTKICSISLATNRSYKDKSGNKQESVEYHSILIFGLLAESCSKWLKKGQQAMVEGRLQTRSWEQDGIKKWKTEIVADTVQFGFKPKNAQGDNEFEGYEVDASTGNKVPTKPKSTAGMTSAVVAPGAKKTDDTQIEYPAEEINPDDIPF